MIGKLIDEVLDQLGDNLRSITEMTFDLTVYPIKGEDGMKFVFDKLDSGYVEPQKISFNLSIKTHSQTVWHLCKKINQ